MNVSYSQLKNILCPIRHYFTLVKNKSFDSFKPTAIGHIVHKIYSIAIKNRNFNFVTSDFINNELDKLDRSSLNSNISEQIQKHLHKDVLKKFPKRTKTEYQYITVTNKLPYINNEVHIYNKLDIHDVQNNIATIHEIKTGKYKQYDPLQLQFYAWSISINTNVEHFVTKVLYTVNASIDVIDLLNKEDLQMNIDRYFESSCKAYNHLDIKNITEVASVLPSLIATNSEKLTDLFNIIHPEQCKSCNSSIICPAYLKEVTKTFENKMSNIPISDILIQCN